MTDAFTVRAVVVFLGLTVLLGLALGGYLAADAKAVPDFLIGTTSGAIGALGALLARTSTSNPQPVTVENDEPVEVTQTPARPARRR